MPTLEYTQDDLISVSGVVTDSSGNPVNLTGAQSVVWKMWRRIDGVNIISTAATPGNQSTTPGSISYTGDANDLSEPSIYAGQFTVKTAGGQVVSWPDPAYVIDVATNPQSGPVPPPQIPVNANIGKFLRTIDDGMGGAAFDWEDTAASGLPAEITARIAGDALAWKYSKLRDAYRETAEALREPGVIPTLTLGTAGVGAVVTSAIAGATLYPPFDSNGSEAGSIFHYTAGYGLALGSSGVDVTQIRPRLLTGSALQRPPYSVKWMMGGVTQFGIKFKSVAGLSLRIRIDGQWVTEGEVQCGGTPGSLYELLVSGLDTGMHTYQIDMPGTFWFGGIFANPVAMFSKPKASGLKAVLLSDSTGGGANGPGTGGYTGVEGSSGIAVWWMRACDLMGWEPYNASIGGTGIVEAGAAVNFQGRVAGDVTPVGADVIVVSGSRNDNVDVQATIQADAVALYQAIQSANPNAVLLAVGPWTGTSRASQYVAVDTAVQAAALTCGVPYMSMWTGNVYDGSGNLLIAGSQFITGSGNISAPVGTARHYYNSFEGTAAQAVTPANSGSGSAGVGVYSPNDPFNAVAGTLTYDATHVHSGAMAAEVDSAAASNASYAFNDATVYGRCYYYFPSACLQQTKVAQCNGNATTNLHRIVLNANTMVLNASLGGGASVVGTVAAATGQWVRIEWQATVNGTTATLTIKLFNSAESGAPSDTVTQSGSFTDVAILLAAFGSGAASNPRYWLDDIEANNTGYPGALAGAVWTKPGNADQAMGPDATHPTVYGHQAWSRAANTAFRAMIGAAGSETV